MFSHAKQLLITKPHLDRLQVSRECSKIAKVFGGEFSIFLPLLATPCWSEGSWNYKGQNFWSTITVTKLP